jgi:hypothetical protein
MRSKNYLIAFAIITFSAAFISCKKNNTGSSSNSEIQTTTDLSTDQAISDNLNADAENVLNEAAVDNNFSGTTPVGVTTTMGLLGCANVTVSPGDFPKTIVIDFGASSGCTPPDGVVRTGKISITLSDSLRHSGSVAVMTFDNYYVSGFKKEGTITWTNTSQGGTKSWERKCENGKITAPDGHFWLHSGTQDVTQTAGADTHFDLTDDVFSYTGTATVTNSAGESRTATIINALEKKVACANIDMGTIKIQGPNHYATIDYGNGTCDRLATVSIDGSASITILLR